MKHRFIGLCLLNIYCICTGCNISSSIDESTKVIEINTQHITQNTKTIRKNVTTLQNSTRAVVENLKEIKSAHVEEIPEIKEEIKPNVKQEVNKGEKPKPSRNFLDQTREIEVKMVEKTKGFFSDPYILFLSSVLIGLMLFVPIYIIYLALSRNSK